MRLRTLPAKRSLRPSRAGKLLAMFASAHVNCVSAVLPLDQDWGNMNVVCAVEHMDQSAHMLAYRDPAGAALAIVFQT